MFLVSTQRSHLVFNINHTILNSVEISAENGVIYASVYNKNGYPFVNLNEPTTITLNGTITACVQNCAVVYKVHQRHLPLLLPLNQRRS
ncbi:hypothetical protein ALON55S_03679 [Alishewanella longhuensis]